MALWLGCRAAPESLRGISETRARLTPWWVKAAPVWRSLCHVRRSRHANSPQCVQCGTVRNKTAIHLNDMRVTGAETRRRKRRRFSRGCNPRHRRCPVHVAVTQGWCLSSHPRLPFKTPQHAIHPQKTVKIALIRRRNGKVVGTVKASLVISGAPSQSPLPSVSGAFHTISGAFLEGFAAVSVFYCVQKRRIDA